MAHQSKALTNRRRGVNKRLGLLGAVLGILLALFAGTASATAATVGAAGGGQPAFAAQARQAGLTGAQATALQNRVNAYLATMHGTQIAANEIRLATGGDLLLTLPGEQHVRSLTATPNGGAIYNCPFFDLCAFRYANYSGDVITAYTCGKDVFIPWIGPAAGGPWGSWVNNQTQGTGGLFLYGNGTVQGATGPALSTHAYQDWTYIANMDPC